MMHMFKLNLTRVIKKYFTDLSIVSQEEQDDDLLYYCTHDENYMKTSKGE
jgi:hypothetical protein